MFVSVIIPTIGRSTLERAVSSVLSQSFQEDEFELLVCNDSGKPLSSAVWQEANNVTILNTNRRERSFARNAGAALAKGKFLCFLDDDDWLLPGALSRAWRLSQNQPRAVWLYGGLRVIDEQQGCLAEMNSGLNGTVFAQVMGGAWVPIQASFINASSFFSVGGFRSYILGTEDLDICRRIAQIGELANSPEAFACLYRGRSWETSTDYGRAAEDTRRSRDEVLRQSGVFYRLLNSADSDYWRGRILRVYLSTARWNLEQRRIPEVLGRILTSVGVLFFSHRHLLRYEFWKGVKAEHVPESLHFVMKQDEEDYSPSLSITVGAAHPQARSNIHSER